MSEEDLQWLKAEIEAHPDKTSGELKEEWKLPCSESRLSRIVREKPGFRRKKDVKLLLENGQDGDVTWMPTRDSMDYPMPEGFSNSGGTLILSEAGSYTLTASADNVHEDETVEIGLSPEKGQSRVHLLDFNP